MVQKEGGRARGRPPAYDADRALTRALDTFWSAGFAGTSLDAISAATGMNRPSLYGAFGDKRALFLKALMSYRGRGEGVMSRLGREGGSLRETLARAYEAALDIYFSGDAGARGCFLTGAALAGAVEDEEVRAALLEGLKELDRGFVGLFERARRTGEIPADADPETLGLVASAVLHTLSIRARAGEARPTLEALATNAAALLAR